MASKIATVGAVIRSTDLVFKQQDGYSRGRVVGPETGSEFVSLDVLRLPKGTSWSVNDSLEEHVVLVYSGAGFATVEGTVEGQSQRLGRASAMHAPTTASFTVLAEEDLVCYVWRTTLLAGRPVSASPRYFSSLWNEETQLKGFAGTGQVAPTDKIATMNFLFWPGTGSAQLCLHCGIQQPGETFSVHMHQHSEDAFIAFEGIGQMYLEDTWVDVSEGDVLFARPTILHGARNPHTGPGAKRFVTCGGPTPFDTFLYDAAGVSAEVL